MSIFGIPLSNGVLPNTLSDGETVMTQYSSLTGMMVKCSVESDVCKLSNVHGVGKRFDINVRLSIVNSNVDIRS